MASIAAIGMGVLSFLNIPVQLLPEGFETRHLTISASLRDSSAEEAERFVAIPLEESLGTVAGLESVSTRCDQNQVRLSVELKSDADPATVERDVRDRVARVEGDLPDDVTRVRVRRRGANDMPIMFFACTAEIDQDSQGRVKLSNFMEDVLMPRVEAVDGVARMFSWGLIKNSCRIWLDQEEIARRGIDLREVLARLRGDNLSADLGDVNDSGRKAYVRAAMEFDSLNEIEEFPVVSGLKLGDIAQVSVVRSIDQAWSRYNGGQVIVGVVYKMAGANTVDTCRNLRTALDGLVAENQERFKALTVKTFFDQGKMIEGSLRTLYENALYGGILAVIVLYGFFRRLRMTLLVAAAIPLSLTMAVTALYLFGDSLNIASMMGLTLAVGMLIDNAIVVVEAVLRRRELGDAPRPAATAGTGEVALAVVTATLTTIVVVAPAIFLSGDTDARLWLLSIGGPIAYALFASLVVALVLVPLGSIYLRRREATKTRPITGLFRRQQTDGDVSETADSDQGFPRPPKPKRNLYERILGGALRHRWVVILGTIALCWSVTIPLGELGRKGAMSGGRGPLTIFMRFPRHYDLKKANETVARYEEFIQGKKKELDISGVFARFDSRGGMFRIWQEDDAATPKEKVRETFREDWPHTPGVWTSLESAGDFGKTRVTLEGEDSALLESTMDRLEARLKELPAVAETKRDREGGGLQELRVSLSRDVAERGLVVPDRIRSMIGWVLRGARLRDYRSGGRDLPLLIEFDPNQEVEVRSLGQVRIPTEQGMKPLSVLADLSVFNAKSKIERRDGRRVAEMQVLGRGDDSRGFHAEVEQVLRAEKLPAGVRFQVGGSWRDLEESFAALFKALLLGGVLVFLLTGILFEAMLLPLAVIFAAPPALVGGLWALHVSGKPMDEMFFLGAILLVGIVVNNGIVLIDRVQQRRREGLPVGAAIRAAGADRLRPVVMTALTTIVGLLPMAVFKGTGESISYDTLATAVIGGLVTSTMLTLVLVPVTYSLLTDFSRIVRRVSGTVAARI